MPPPPRAKAALVAMKNIGFSSKVAAPVLKKLLEVYENNWEYIEENSYQVLIDSILEQQDSMGGGEKQDGVVVDDAEHCRKRPRKLSDGPSQTIFDSVEPSSRKPKLEADVSSEAHVKELKEPWSPHVGIRGRAEPESSQLDDRGIMTESALQQPSPSSQSSLRESQFNRRETRASSRSRIISDAPENGEQASLLTYSKGKQVAGDGSKNLFYFKEPKIEPDIEVQENTKAISPTRSNNKDADNDMLKFETPIAMICPANHSIPAESEANQYRQSQRDTSPRNISGLQAGAAEHSPHDADKWKGQGSIISQKEKESEVVASQEASSTVNIASSDTGEDMCQFASELTAEPSENGQENSEKRKENDESEKRKEEEAPKESSSLMVVPQPEVALGDLRPPHDPSDISKGEERVRISLVNDVSNEKYPSSFHYIPRNLVYQNAYVNFSLARIGDEDCCSDCFGDCLAASIPCACARETGGEFAYTSDGLVKDTFLDECVSMNREPQKHHHVFCRDCPLERSRSKGGKCKGHLVRKFIKECWSKCGCNMKCRNRTIQRGITCNLQVFFTPEGKGWGLRTLDELPRGAFVCEYVGEILTNIELYNRTIQTTGNAKHTYPVLLDADWGSEGVLKDEEALCLDATFYGNVARFVNHRCGDANLVEIPVEVETPDHHYYHLAFFATRKIEPYEELTWDYGIDFDDVRHPVKAFKCRCGSKLCRDAKRSKSRSKALVLK